MIKTNETLNQIQEAIYKETRYFVPLAVLECIADMLSGKIKLPEKETNDQQP